MHRGSSVWGHGRSERMRRLSKDLEVNGQDLSVRLECWNLLNEGSGASPSMSMSMSMMRGAGRVFTTKSAEVR